MNAEVKEAQAARQADSADPKAGRPRAGSRGPALPSGPRNGTPIGLRKPPSLSTLAMPSFAGARTLSDETLAKIAGLVSDLHLTGLQYNLCAAMFFVSALISPDGQDSCLANYRSRIACLKSPRTSPSAPSLHCLTSAGKLSRNLALKVSRPSRWSK